MSTKHNSISSEDFNSFFNSFDINSDDKISINELLNLIKNRGISFNDVRLQNIKNLSQNNNEFLSKDEFIDLLEKNNLLLSNIIRDNLIIPKWDSFCQKIDQIYFELKGNKKGNVASYIPQLAKVNPELFSICITSIDGQQYSIGDYDYSTSVQSCSKPISYCIAVEEHGEAIVHNHIGREPSGKNFNELCLDEHNLPHNPLINSGAIMAVSLIKYKETQANRFDYIKKYWQELAGDTKVNFNNSVYLSEKDSANRNFCLGYMMQEKESFSKGKNENFGRDWDDNDLQKNLELYFQCCSIEINCQQASVIAASLANGGVCPTTGKKIFDSNNVKNVLSLMSSCGMYDYSGEWAYTIGIPAKSGVSGIIMGIIPNVMGIAVFSPRLDNLGNSVGGIEFFKKLISKFNFHAYDNLANNSKLNITLNKENDDEVNIYLLLKSASKGDLNGIKKLAANNCKLDSYDYDGRTALHLAASEGHLNIVKYLLSKGVDQHFKDRWGNTAYDDAIRENNNDIANYIINK